MRVIVIGASGTIGSAVARALASRHEVVAASREGPEVVDIEAAASIEALFERTGPVDAVVCCAGSGAFGPFAQLTEEDYQRGLRSKLMGQVNLARIASTRVRDGGVITLTTGVLAQHPTPGSALLSMVNAGLEAFVRAAALELPRGLRINAVSPPWVKETMVKLGMDPSPGLAADDLARAYVRALEGDVTGRTLQGHDAQQGA